MIVLRSPSAVHIEGTFRAASLPAAAAAAAVPAAKPAVPAPQARSSPFLSVPEDLQTTYKREEKIEKKITQKIVRKPALFRKIVVVQRAAGVD